MGRYGKYQRKLPSVRSKTVDCVANIRCGTLEEEHVVSMAKPSWVDLYHAFGGTPDRSPGSRDLAVWKW